MTPLTEQPETLLSLYRISQAASGAYSPRDAYTVITGELQRLYAPHATAISLINPNTSLLEIEYALGYPTNTSELSIHPGKGLEGRVAFNGDPMLCSDVLNDPRYVKLCEGVRSKIIAPMISNGHIIGVLSVSRDKVNAFTQAELDQLVLLAHESSQVLQSVWHRRQLANQSEQLNALIEVGQNIVSNFETHSLWETVTEAAMELTRARLCTLQLFDSKTQKVKLLTARPLNNEYTQQVGELDLSESLAGSAIRTKRQVEFTNITTPDYLDLKDVPVDSEVTSCLSTPMIYEGKVTGILNVFTKVRHRFPNSERRLLQAFADLAAVAAQNAELYTRVFNSEERLRKSERLTTLGLLSAEIAHEIRNPLTVIKLLFGSLGLDYPESDPRHKDKQVIKEKFNQLEEIVSKVLSFGKAPEGIFTIWNIDELVADTCLLVRHKMRQLKIDLEHQPADSRLKVNGNKGQLQQVLLNLIINASDAMPDGGRLTISTRAETTDKGKHAVLFIEDTGTGIPANLVERVFDSFLTDKPEGTGLGLSIVKRILRSHHGDISVSKTGPTGTTMRIELPIHR
ncbi:GAF domain-containing protein [Pelagicoccus sp. SDUM812005]|uniref:GAF domain-containing protein n=1 Tax=Pelagicoccus sp. SDUM812005 TaxID=3041257 RepID=UPI00280DE331|nr:GAF domain-containing protein [Pelagicoccus sp. SDUM812005]MDQ8183644.1 GAF domain-containing protein [Pelagicoccus sp. SDUM812005]